MILHCISAVAMTTAFAAGAVQIITEIPSFVLTKNHLSHSC